MTIANRNCIDNDAAAAVPDPRARSMTSWRASLGVMASRGEISGPRVEQARRALGWWRLRDAIGAEVARGTIDANLGEHLVDELTTAMTP